MTLLTAVYAHSTFRYARGDLAQQAGRYEDAIRLFRLAAEGRNPIGRGVAYTALARVYLKLNRSEEALQALRQAASRTKTPSIVLAIYQLFADTAALPATADKEAVLHEGEKLVLATGMPKTMKAVALGQFAGVWYRLGNYTEAARVSALALANDPLNGPALFTAGWLDLGRGEFSQAKERFVALVNLSANDQKQLGAYGQGALAFAEGRWSDAEEFFRKVAKPAAAMLEPIANARLAMALALQGKDGAQALKKAESALTSLRERGLIRAESGAHWLVKMAAAYVTGNPQAARQAEEAAPAEEKPEAAWFSEVLEHGTRSKGWLQIKA